MLSPVELKRARGAEAGCNIIKDPRQIRVRGEPSEVGRQTHKMGGLNNARHCCGPRTLTVGIESHGDHYTYVGVCLSSDRSSHADRD